jgi:hypothetical protein
VGRFRGGRSTFLSLSSHFSFLITNYSKCGSAQGIEAEIPQASGVGAEELERIARFFAAVPDCAAKNAPKFINKFAI